MGMSVNISRHGVDATLVPLAPRYWRIAIDGGRGGRFEHQGSRESAEHRAGWECWCYKRLSENPPVLKPAPSDYRPSDLVSAYFDQDDGRAARRRASL